jgi:putative drug exporter of the RND superfamily
VVMNLLTVGAAFGVLCLLFQGRHPLLGGPGYIDTLALTGTFTVIFALSIDYQLFLLSRMREAHQTTGSATASIEIAIARTASIILGAAAIMIAVFAAFATGSFSTVRQLGVGLTTAIVLDATVVRLLLLPALVRLLGERSWWLPSWAVRLLPDRSLSRPRAEKGIAV